MGGSIDGHPLGVQPSPSDERDYRYPAYGRMVATADMPSEYACGGIHYVDDQGAVNSCVAHSLGLVKDWQEYRESGFIARHSRQFIYANRPDSWDWHGPGMVPRFALNNLRKFGTPRENVWPGIVEYGQEDWPDRYTTFELAAPFKISTYVGIYHRFIPELKSAVYTTGPVLYCVPVHSNFYPDDNGVIPLPSGTLRGYHAMAVVGWRHGLWLVQNSWGKGWGVNGRCWVPWDYPASEVWGVTDAETVRVRRLHLIEGEHTLWVDGRPVEVDRAPIIVDDRFYGVARHIVEQLGGAVVGWGRYEDGPHEGRMWAQLEMRDSPW